METNIQNKIAQGNGMPLIEPLPFKSFEDIVKDIARMPPAHKTGYESLDKFVRFNSGTMNFIAGRPSHGKTTFMFNLMMNMLGSYPRESFYFFTYEEPAKHIVVKLLNRIISKDLSQHFPSGITTNYDYLKHYLGNGLKNVQEVNHGIEEIKELIDSKRMRIIDKNYTVEDLAEKVKKLTDDSPHKPGIIFIDYVQRMRTERLTNDTRTKIAHISDRVLQIAKEIDLPIILGAQLNRAAAGKEGSPSLENLKEAGNLEEDANTVLSVYNENREKKESNSYPDVALEITALKNREGEVNKSTQVVFNQSTGKISDTPTKNITNRF